MKRMVYIIIAVATIAISVAVATGCAVNPPKDNEPKPISGVSFSQQHMNFNYYYSFYIRKDNGKIFFDADVRFDEAPCEVVLEGCEVDKTDYEKVLSVIEKYNIYEFVKHYKQKKLPFEVSDKTEKVTTLYFTDGTLKSADTGADYEQELYDLFKEIAVKYHKLYAKAQK